MEASKSLRRPANWQDFESLCKKLWGEIWNCPEIQKNGRLGQKQSGVDIFGIPEGKDGYYGIQCKGKDEYTHAQFTENEIEQEIMKAKQFTPPLKKLYLATTAVNDVKIQEFVRHKNLEHRAQKLFEVHLFCWETIVDLIDENKQTYDYYVKSRNFKTDKKVDVSFADGRKEMSIHPIFIKYRQVSNGRKKFDTELEKEDSLFPYIGNPRISIPKRKINYSFSPIEISVRNIGKDPIEDYKLVLQFQGDIKDMSWTNIDHIFMRRHDDELSRLVFNGENCVDVIPKRNMLVNDDQLLSEKIFINPAPNEGIITLKWKLISKDFKVDGELPIHVIPHIEIIDLDYILVSPEEIGKYPDGIEDCIVEEDN